MRVAFIGTRGVPARYGGFETAAEEIGKRLAAGGHEVVVYCRAAEERLATYEGMELVHLPALRSRTLETLSHTALSVLHAFRHRPDAAIVFNAANAPLLPILKAARTPFAVHVDGLEWQRAKWGGAGRRYYRAAERLSVRWADDIIADARAIQEYYRKEHDSDSTFIAYGAPIIEQRRPELLAPMDLSERGYHLVVARFEPENHVDLIVEGYSRSSATLPLVVVGSAPYAEEYTQRIERLAEADPRVQLVGAVWDQELLDQLYANSLTYIHGHSVGGTNPSLLRAMGAAAPVIAYDVEFCREVAGAPGEFFADPAQLAEAVDRAEADVAGAIQRGEAGRARAAREYRWDDVAADYEALLERLVRRSAR